MAGALPDPRPVRGLAEPVCPDVSSHLMALSLLRQFFGHIHLGKSAEGLDDQPALLLVRVKPALHLMESIPRQLPGSGQLHCASTTERYHDLPISRSRPGKHHVGLYPCAANAN